MTPLRVAVLGLGDAGFAMHLPALASIPQTVVVAACDHDPARRERAKAKWGVPVFAEASDGIEKAAPDIVIVATPPATHAELCLRSIDAGADVICEKPFVQKLAEADEVIERATEKGRRVSLNHEFREMPIFRALIDATASDAGRDIVFAQAWQLMDMPPWKEEGWRGEMERRTLHEAGIHLVDFLMALFREVPVAVTATMSGGGLKEGFSDAVCAVTLEFSRGRMAQLIQNRLCKGDTHYFEVRADTTATSLRASFGGRARITTGLHRSKTPHLRMDYGISGMAWEEGKNKRRILARNPRDPRMVATRSVIAQTIRARETGGEPTATADHGRNALRVIDACYSAATSGQRITL